MDSNNIIPSFNNFLEPFILFSLFVTLITISLFAWAFSKCSVAWTNGCSKYFPGLKSLPILGSMLNLSHALAHHSLASITFPRGSLNKQLMAFSRGSIHVLMSLMTCDPVVARCCMMMVVMVAIVPSLAAVEEDEKIGITNMRGYTNVTFELTNGVIGYSSFLTRSRNAVEAPTRVCGLQSTRTTPLLGAEYIYVNLKISNTQWVTLGVDVTTFYIWGYQDNVIYNGKYRANFLNDAPMDAKNKLFRGSTIRITRFGANYNDLERATHTSRLNLVLGIQNLDGAIRAVYGRQENQLNQGDAEAKFIFIAIQMVAEAARFKFMEEAIVRNINTPEFKRKMVAFQNDWDAISSSFHKSEAEKIKCTRFMPPLLISNTGYRQEVNTVAEIKNDMSLIKY